MAQIAGPLREALDCLRCGACLNVCPVYRQIGGHAYGYTYPGPIGILLTAMLHGDGALPPLIPPDAVETYRASDELVRLRNGSEIIFRSLDEPGKLLNLSLGGVFVDQIEELDEGAEEGSEVLALDFLVHGRGLGGEALHGADDRKKDEAHNQAVFDRGRSAIVRDEPAKRHSRPNAERSPRSRHKKSLNCAASGPSAGGISNFGKSFGRAQARS